MIQRTVLTNPCLSLILLVSFSLWKDTTFCIHCSPVDGESGWMYIRFGISGSALPATIHRLQRGKEQTPFHSRVLQSKFWNSPVVELVSIVVSRHNIKQQNVLGLCIQSRNSKLHLGKHLSEKRERGNVSVVLLSVPRPRQLTKDNEGGNCDNYSVHVGYPLENCFVGSPKLFTTSNHCSPFCRPPHPESHLVAPLTPAAHLREGMGTSCAVRRQLDQRRMFHRERRPNYGEVPLPMLLNSDSISVTNKSDPKHNKSFRTRNKCGVFK